MEVVLFAGSHPRHLYVAQQLADNDLLAGLVVEEREQFNPQPPERLNKVDRQNFIRHFEGRARAEKETFGEIKVSGFNEIPKIEITKEELNSDRVKNWVNQLNPKLVITFGVHMIEEELLAQMPDYAWNLHGGLSPWYRGCITLFWPFYFLQPNWAGMTIHYLSSELDGGDIVHHSRPELKYGDGIHDVAARAVVKGAKDLVNIIKILENNKRVPKKEQKSDGKLFLGRDWKPEQLRLIYNTFDNDIVDEYLEGKLNSPEPNLITAF